MSGSVVVQAILVFVFSSSSVLKALDPKGTVRAVQGFGVPAAGAGVVAIGLIVAELLVVAGLLVVPRHGALGAFVLLTVLSGAVAVLLARGTPVACHCFGPLSKGQASVGTLLRNAGLGVLALLLLADRQPASSSGGWWLSVVLGAFSAAAAFRALRLGRDQHVRRTRQHGFLLRSGDRSPAGSDRPSVPSDAAPPRLLFFLSSGCSGCKQLAPEVERWTALLRPHVDVTVVRTGPDDASLAFSDAAGLDVVLDEQEDVAADWGLAGYPATFMLVPGREARGPAYGLPAAAALVLEAIHAAAPQRSSGARTPVTDPVDWAPAHRPALVSQTLEDGRVVLEDRLSGATLALDPVAALVWTRFDGVTPLRTVGAALAQAFGAPVDVVTSDVVKMARDLASQGMLWGVFEQSAGSTRSPAHTSAEPLVASHEEQS